MGAISHFYINPNFHQKLVLHGFVALEFTHSFCA